MNTGRGIRPRWHRPAKGYAHEPADEVLMDPGVRRDDS